MLIRHVSPNHRRVAVHAALVSVASGLVILGLKFAAFAVTGSVALFSDAAESVINVLAAVLVTASLVVADRPPDQRHPYGHGKAEYIASTTEGFLVLAAAVWIAWTSVGRLIDPVMLRDVPLGVAMTTAAAFANLLIARYLLRVSRETESIALEADARHLLTDVVTSAGVLVALVVELATGLRWIDPAIALLLSAHLAATGYRLVRRSWSGLLDDRLSPDEEANVREILDSHKAEIVSYHAFRSRRAGARRFIDLHLVVDPNLTVRAAHALCDDLEDHIEAALPGTDVTIHVEPASS
jgi:cation diffusion facilitator family transporter